MALPVILILAAGASSRMGGRDKLLEPVAGCPLLRLMAERALAAGAPVLVVLPPDRPARIASIEGLGVTQVIAEDAAKGMGHSLRAGIAALPRGTSAAMILPADMPGITTGDILTLLQGSAEAPELILRGATTEGRPGHPVLFPAALFPDLLALKGDEGARAVLKANARCLKLVPLPGDHAVLDMDTPEAWTEYRARQG